ncbi:MAG: hypothetical protein LC772_02810, partial [Chloroflexi bacterium]|nr:hypothetical protein [Chloroflexota bacterium]
MILHERGTRGQAATGVIALSQISALQITRKNRCMLTMKSRGSTWGRGAARTAVLGALVAALSGANANAAFLRPDGAPTSSSVFPIAVWLQSPENAAKYRAAGINLYVGLWQGPTEAQLAALKAAGMPVICEQTPVGLAHLSDPTIAGWMQGDEPDNAQPITDPVTGKPSYGPDIPPAKVEARYHAIKQADPSRPSMLNLGQGVTNPNWNGRGSGARMEDYLDYVKGGDIVSFDVYPAAGLGREDGANYLWYVPQGVDRLAKWSGGKKRIWNCIECTHIGEANHLATPAQVRAEVWMSLIHGSKGLIYFVHEFKPRFNEHALLDNPPMLAAVTAINRQIASLAPVLNSPTMNGARAASSDVAIPIDVMMKRHGGATYLFAVGMRNGPAAGT